MCIRDRVGVARTDDGDAEGECFHERGQSYGIGEVQAADHDTTFACHQFPQFVGNHSVGIMDANGVEMCIRDRNENELNIQFFF